MKSSWVHQAIHKINSDFQRSSDTHLILFELPHAPGIQLYFKDESTHPTGSLKHRLARSLFLYGLCNGWIHEGTTLIEASSGSTAVSEAYFARLLGLPFIAVMPKGTSCDKIKMIELYGGRCHLIDDASAINEIAQKLAVETKGHFMDQFTYAERATDWRGNNNIAETIFAQMKSEPHPIPEWIVVGAGTGGTSATLGRYIRYQEIDTKICVVDPENSVFYDAFTQNDCSLVCEGRSKIEGIGRPRVEPSFMPSIIDRMIKVKDDASYAAMHFLECHLGKRVGASTGTNFFGAMELISEMIKAGKKGSVVTLLCDHGERYVKTCYNQDWLKSEGHQIEPWLKSYEDFFKTSKFISPN